MQRKYDPTLLYALAVKYAQGIREAEQIPQAYRQELLGILIYVRGKSGAHYVYHGKLYWDDTVGDGYHCNAGGQDDLENDAADLREVVLQGVKQNRTDPVAFGSFQEFLDAVGFKE